MYSETADFTGSAGWTERKTPSALHWYLVHCKAHQDERALEHLQRQGFQCYRPMRLVERLREGRRSIVGEPLFPRYLFIRLDSVNDNWYPIRSTRGVHQIVRFNAPPLPVQDEVIEVIRARLSGNEMREAMFTPGELVRIGDGPFSQLEAIFIANDGDERVALLLNILQEDQVLSFPATSVRKLG